MPSAVQSVRSSSQANDLSRLSAIMLKWHLLAVKVLA